VFLAPATGVTFAKANYSVNPSFGDMFVWEIAGLVSPTIDKHVSATGTSNAPASGTTGTLSAANEAAIAFAVHTNSITVAGSGWTNLTTTPNTVAGGEERVVSANTALNGNFTASASNPWVALCATFMAGGAAPPNGWWRDESENLPKPPVRFAVPPPAFVSTFKTAVIAGTGWHRNFPEANPKPPVRFQPPPPAFISTFKTAVISGIAFSRNEPESNPKPPRRFEIPPAWDPQPIGQVVTAPPNGWLTNPESTRPRRAPIDYPAPFLLPTAPPPNGWFVSQDGFKQRPAPIDYPVPFLLPIAPPPTGWWAQSDKAPTKRVITSDPPPLIVVQAVVTWSFAVSDTIKARVPPQDSPPAFGSPPADTSVGISGMAWFAPPDRDRPAVKVTVETLVAVCLTPDTLPVPISGMAWFQPWERAVINRGISANTASAWEPQFIVPPTAPPASDFTFPFIANVGTLMNR
jgi:hypothetical protein